MNKFKESRLLMVIPNSRWGEKRNRPNFPFTAFILTAILKDEFNLNIIDANGLSLSEEECQLRMAEFNPEMVLISGQSVEYHLQVHTSLELSKNISKDIITVMGGVYPTVQGKDVLKDTNMDYIFLGHAEERLVGFLKIVLSGDKKALYDLPGVGFRDENGEIIINPVESHLSSVKTMVRPDYSLLDITPYLIRDTLDYQTSSHVRSAEILTTYGCPYNCSFCASWTISGRRVVYRPVEDVLAEIEYFIKEHKVEEVVFFDDCLLMDKKRVYEIFSAFIERKYDLKWKAVNATAWHLDNDILQLLKESGCKQLTISVESGSQRVLKEIVHKPLKLEIVPYIVKKCQELGITITSNFVIGFPGETWEEIRATFRFAEECNFDLIHFFIATPQPETDLYYDARDQGLLPDDFSFFKAEFQGFGRAFITTDEFTPEDLMILRAYEWDRINFKTLEKTVKIADIYGLSLEELEEHRRDTRRKLGIHFSK